MRRKLRFLLPLPLLAILLWTGCDDKANQPMGVLVFSKTAGYRHASIADGKRMFLQLGRENNFRVDTTEDATVFTQANLSKYKVVVFLSTTGDILDTRQQEEFQRFIQAGGGFVGIHAAADTEYDWPWYNKLVGAYFESHPNDPNIRKATVRRVQADHPAVKHLPDAWEREDEWYNYKSIQNFTTLLRVDESTYEGGTNGDNHPISWYKEVDGGRMFYTGLGHTEASYTEDNFLRHVLGGLLYAAGDQKPVDYRAATVMPEENRFPVSILTSNLAEPMELELLPDGRPLWIERKGAIWVYDPDFEEKAKVGEITVDSDFEDGLMGLALDPGFKENNWLYLYYSPLGEGMTEQYLSRFTWTGNGLDMDSEKVLLKVKTDRNMCCHSGGSIEFGPGGLLHLSVGDDTNPFESDGFAPIDPRAGEKLPNFDARRSSSNSQDLRGKILRIKPEPDGTYSIPEGNLFTDPAQGRPEIYVMGCRNPFRIAVDQHTGAVYWGDVGPDAGENSDKFGPRGHDEVNVAPTAGYYGWPLFVADNKTYHQRDFKTGKTGSPFDPEHPINDSPLNTGLRELPPARPAMIYYPYAQSDEFPELGEGGRNAMAGPIYHASDYADSESRFPDYYDGKFFFYDWMRHYIMAATVDEEGWVQSYERFLPNVKFPQPMDMLFSPQGDMYVLTYGTKWFSQNPDAQIMHIKYNSGNRPPVADLAVEETIGGKPFRLQAASAASVDYDDDPLTTTWLLNGKEIDQGEVLDYNIAEAGVYKLLMRVDDGQGNTAQAERELIVGNALPQLALNIKGNRTFYFDGTSLDYTVDVSDSEDGELNSGISPEAVTVSLDYLEGNDEIQIQQGHQMATEETKFVLGKNFIAESDCSSCHQVAEKSIGPTYNDIADKYRTDRKADTYLTGKIIKGGGGVWGEQAMAAHPNLPASKVLQMVHYIRSLGDPNAAPATPSLPVTDRVRLLKHQSSREDGRYYLMATYTDQGVGELPRLTSRDVVVLRSPRMAPDKFTSHDKVLAQTLSADDNPLGDQPLDLLVGTRRRPRQLRRNRPDRPEPPETDCPRLARHDQRGDGGGGTGRPGRRDGDRLGRISPADG